MIKNILLALGVFFQFVANAGVHVVGNGAGILEAQMIITFQKLPKMLQSCSQNTDCQNNIGADTLAVLSNFAENYQLLFYTESQYPFSHHQFIIEKNDILINVDQLYLENTSVLHFDDEQALAFIFKIANTKYDFNVDYVKSLFVLMFKSKQLIKEFDSYGPSGVYFVYDQLFAAKMFIHDSVQEIDLNDEMAKKIVCDDFKLSSITNLRILMPLQDHFQLYADTAYQCRNKSFSAKIVIQGKLVDDQSESSHKQAKQLDSFDVSIWDIENIESNKTGLR